MEDVGLDAGGRGEAGEAVIPVLYPPDAAVVVADEDYLDWCRGRSCYFHRKRYPMVLVYAEPHHVVLKGMGGARVRDDYAVPACRECHDRCHGVRKPRIPYEEQVEAARASRLEYFASLAPRLSW